MSLSFRHNGVLYIFDERELLRSLPSEVLKDALRRGKATRRSRQQREREAASAEVRAIKRDRMVSEGRP